MPHHTAEHYLQLHHAEQARLLTAAEHRRNAERRRTGTPDPMRGHSPIARLLRRALRAMRPARPRSPGRP
ncbi:hypothetical protein [Arthrobacter sp. CAN_C5]|uniref:hypothetical protein n=1 Tax=Arthrobacter sp. CAN_C5 TaxID=2760706 RepID=UPI001AE6F1D7|nr:hypothetical protein [Arthrobacter sp. CAN_C5]MBP2215082.1 hypothetical protein [Arthrobacter sp. CAN_C5]